MGESFSRRDYYRILQVDRSAHPEVIRAAFRTLLRVLGKHPDLGGTDADARLIIEAYQTLGDPERRGAYDLWLKAHSGPSHASRGLHPGVARWLLSILPDYRDARQAPFRSRFDLVLTGPRPTPTSLYVKGFPVLLRAQWPAVLALVRATRLWRTGLLPTTDVFLLVARHAQDVEAFLAEVDQAEGGWGWNRSVVALCTLVPPRLHTGRVTWQPEVLRRLQKHLSRLDPDKPAG